MAWALWELSAWSPPQWRSFETWFPQTVILLILSFGFARSLFRGEALITRVARMARAGEFGGLPDELAGYTRRLTVIWAWLLFGCAAATPVLAAWPRFPHPGIPVVALIAAFIVGEYLFRRLRFRQYPHRSLMYVLRFMLQHGLPRD
jgi:uncharacterized membrane protein